MGAKSIDLGCDYPAAQLRIQILWKRVWQLVKFGIQEWDLE